MGSETGWLLWRTKTVVVMWIFHVFAVTINFVTTRELLFPKYDTVGEWYTAPIVMSVTMCVTWWAFKKMKISKRSLDLISRSKMLKRRYRCYLLAYVWGIVLFVILESVVFANFRTK